MNFLSQALSYLSFLQHACGYIIGINHETAFDVSHFLSILIGVGLLAASSCALNQIQERTQDKLMKRTQHRPLPSGRITLPHALFFLSHHRKHRTEPSLSQVYRRFFIGLLSFFLYNGLYTLWWKPTLAYAAIPGAIPGALPIYIGFVSSSHTLFSTQGIYLFCILFFWQMPHFWALALRYEKDYAQAGFPILPVVKGQSATLRSITLWCLGYISLMHISLIFFKLSTLSILMIACINVLLIKALFSFRRHPSHWLQFFFMGEYEPYLFSFHSCSRWTQTPNPSLYPLLAMVKGLLLQKRLCSQ